VTVSTTLSFLGGSNFGGDHTSPVQPFFLGELSSRLAPKLTQLSNSPLPLRLQGETQNQLRPLGLEGN
jgi:hypothetical protein